MSEPTPSAENGERHHPACDTRLGPDFKVEPGQVTMTLFACFGECWDEYRDIPPGTGDTDSR